MFLPGKFVSAVTFPGVIIHELAHQLFCRLFRVAVFEVCYFQFEQVSGYVIHEKPRRNYQQIIIGIGPFLVNSIIGAVIAFPAVFPVLYFESGTPLDYLLMWLGVSIAMHAFPSTGDAASIWKAVRSPEASYLARIVAAPIVLVIYLGAAGSVMWMDLMYGMLITTAVPNTIAKTYVAKTWQASLGAGTPLPASPQKSSLALLESVPSDEPAAAPPKPAAKPTATPTGAEELAQQLKLLINKPAKAESKPQEDAEATVPKVPPGGQQYDAQFQNESKQRKIANTVQQRFGSRLTPKPVSPTPMAASSVATKPRIASAAVKKEAGSKTKAGAINFGEEMFSSSVARDQPAARTDAEVTSPN